MTDASNHWDALASLLGAEPAPEAGQEQPAGPAAEPTKNQPERVPPAARAAAPRPRRPAANWDEVAGSLGITPPPPPPPRPPAAPSLPPSPAREAFPPPRMPIESLGPPPSGFAELAEELAEEMAAVDEGPADFVPEPAEPEEKTGHRRRKRRRRGRGSREGAFGQPPTDAGPPERGESPLELSEEEEIAPPLGPMFGEGGVSVEPARERRPEHRRGRRGRSRSGDRPRRPGREAAGPEAVDEEQRRADVVADEAVDEDIELGALDLPEEGDDAGEGDVAAAKAGFRSIPTWQEAVGILVTANLESRARRPGNGAPAGRGGRGPRDNRRDGGGNRGSRPRGGKRR